jgi:Mlc titration factor MtfA (ptsG expression regulator)
VSWLLPIGSGLLSLWLASRLRARPSVRPHAPRSEPELDFFGPLLRVIPGVPDEQDRAAHQRFMRIMNDFARVPIEGHAGMTISSEVRTRIAASAARFVSALGDDAALAAVSELHVHPHSLALGDRRAGGMTRLLPGGRIRVAVGYWQVLQSHRRPVDGYDVLLHEFAHVLDGSDGTFDGIPRGWVSDVPAFEQALEHASARLFEAEPGAMPLRPYATVSRAELFAVASEAYFECSEPLREHMPPLFDALHQLYGRTAI